VYHEQQIKYQIVGQQPFCRAKMFILSIHQNSQFLPRMGLFFKGFWSISNAFALFNDPHTR
jgi:hypothetical protein